MKRFVILLVLLTSAGSAEASTIHVPAGASTIQTAINFAVSGDTVLIAPGIYQENLVIEDRAIALIGEFGADSTVLEPLFLDDHTLLLENTGGVVVFSGFTVQNSGDVETVWIGENAPSTIRYCVFHDNISDAINPLTVIRCGSPSTVAFNLFYANSGVCSILAHARCRIVNNTIDGNSRGIYADYHGDGSVAYNNCITGNDEYGIEGHFDSLGFNNVWGNGDNTPIGANGLSVDPLYVDPAARDYHLQAGSPCLDAADPDVPEVDQQGLNGDIGAFQTLGTPPIAIDLEFVGQDQLHIVDSMFQFVWSYFDTAATTQQGYEIEIWTDSATWYYFGRIWTSGQVLSPDSGIVYSGDSLRTSRSYLLRIRLFNGAVWGGWKQRQFRLNTPPPLPPGATLPRDSESLGAGTVYLSVAAVSDFEDDPVSYEYEVYSDPSLTTSVASGSFAAEPGAAKAVTDTLLLDTVAADYWWRIRTSDGYAASPWSPIRTFSVRATPSSVVVPVDYQTISRACEVAFDGDTVTVLSGTYHENIRIVDKSLTLVAGDGREQTFIEPHDYSRPILYCANTQDVQDVTRVDGFTFRNATLSRAVHLDRCRVRFEHNEIVNCTTDSSGAGLFADRAVGAIADNLIHDNQAAIYGGGVYLSFSNSDSLYFGHNHVYRNAAQQGSGVYVQGGWDQSAVTRNVFRHNTGTDSSAALFVNSSLAEVTNNTIVSNNAGYGRPGSGGQFFSNIIGFNRNAAIVGMSNPSVAYCCVYGNGGAPVEVSFGTTEDPLFVDTASHDYRLRSPSPCINSGLYSDQRRDPDGTRIDIGTIPYMLTAPTADELGFDHYPMEHMLSHHPIFVWRLLDTLSSTQLSYEIEVATEREPFAGVLWQSGEVFSNDSIVQYAGDSLTDGDNYVYRIRLSTATGTGDWCYGTFHMNALPPTPTPKTPIDGLAVHADAIQLRADTVVDAEGDIVLYYFELFADSQDSVPIWSLGNSRFTQVVVDTPLTPGNTYWWRVRSYDQYEYSPWSERQSFVVRSGPRVVTVPDEYATLQAALDILSAGDTVRLAAGTYAGDGYRDLQTYDKAIAMVGVDGAEATTIDLDGSILEPHRLLAAHHRSRATFQDLTITGGYADTGGVVRSNQAQFVGCVLHGNAAGYGGVFASNYTITITDCIMRDNQAEFGGGVSSGGRMEFTNCTFSGNSAGLGGVSYDGFLTYTGCTFIGNEATTDASCVSGGYDVYFNYCLIVRNSGPTVVAYGRNHFNHCTIAFNEGDIGRFSWDFGAMFSTSIVAFNEGITASCDWWPDPPSYYPDGAVGARHSDLYGNQANFPLCLGPDEGRDGNISLDPMFCDPENNNFHLQAGSACLGAGEDGTDIGAFGAGCIPTDVGDDDNGTLPSIYALAQNYPNPFNPTTLIAFELPKQSAIRLEVYNVLGQRVRVLVDRTLPAGAHEVAWDGNNSGGGAVSSGVYFYRLTTDEWSRSRKMLLLK